MTTNLLPLFKSAMLCATVAAASLSASAAVGDKVNLGELQNGVPTEYPGGFASVEATFTVPETGPMRVLCSGDPLYAYTDAEHENGLPSDFSYVDGKKMYVYECTKDQQIYLYNNFVMDGGTITVTSGEMKLELITAIPSDDPNSKYYYGGTYSISSDYRVHYAFNMPIEIAGARLSVGGSTVALTPDVATTTAEVTISPILMNMYKAGTLKKGDTVHVELYGVHEKGNDANQVNGTGLAAVDLVVDAQPVELVSTKNTPASGTSKFLSYYKPGVDASKVSMTFSGELDPEHLPECRLEYGDIDNIEVGMYIEQLTGTVEGNTITFDLSGVRRRPQDMLPALENPTDFITMIVIGVKSADGQYAYTGALTNPFSYLFNYDLQVLQYNVVSDFTPSESKGLTEGEELEIFVMEGVMISFDGVEFDYTAAGEPKSVVVDKDELEIAYEYGTDLVITLPVPALPGIDADSPVTVTLTNMECEDGLDHTDNVKAVYNTYTAGLNGIAAEADGTADIYNAQGIRIMKGATHSQLRSLPAGLYIMGGQKYIVR